MGDRGGGYGGRREGAGRGNLGGGRKPAPPTQVRNLVWQRQDPPPTAGGARSAGYVAGDRWDMAARTQGGGAKEWPNPPPVASTAVPKGPPAPAPVPQSDPSSKAVDELCHNCNLPGHFAPRCPTIRCEKCGKLGHMAQLCQTLRPWECIPSMCGFQSPGQGFFYLPDLYSAKQAVEKTNNVVITIVEGVASMKDIETEFNGFFAHMPEKKRWRCTARPISPTQFVMRFPNAREVERACCYGKRLPLKNGLAVVCITPWSASVGAKADLQTAWVRVRNVPLEKRCVEHVSYAGGLVGVTLEVDTATLHKPEYARILLGCREMEKIPPSAEGVLGRKFYDFFYEVEKVVVGGPERNQSSVPIDNSSSPNSSKRARYDMHTVASSDQGETSASVVGNSNSQTYDKSTQRLDVVSETEEEDESEEGDHTELLIETMAKEHEARVQSDYNSPVVDVSSDNKSVGMDVSSSFGGSPGSSGTVKADYVTWPALPRVVELEEGSHVEGRACSEYTVESPTGSPIHVYMSPEKNEHAPRNQYQKLTQVEEMATGRLKKRNLEGLLKESDKVGFQAGVKKMAQVAAALVDRSNRRGRLMVGDVAGSRIG